MTPVERRASILASAVAVNYYTTSAIILAALTFMAIVVVAVFAPTSVGTVVPVIVSIATPLLMALLAAGQKGIATITNGQKDQIIRAMQEAEHAKGVNEGIRAAPEILKEAVKAVTPPEHDK